MKNIILVFTLIGPLFAQAETFCSCESYPVNATEISIPGRASVQYRSQEQEQMCFSLARNWANRKCVALNNRARCAVRECHLQEVGN